LPEPFGPTSAVIDPGASSSETPSTAGTAPKCFAPLGRRRGRRPCATAPRGQEPPRCRAHRRNECAAPGREHGEQEQGLEHRLKARARNPGECTERACGERDQAEDDDARARSECCGRTAHEYRDEELEREQRPIGGRIGDDIELHDEAAGEPAYECRGGERAYAKPLHRHAQRRRGPAVLSRRGEVESERPAAQRDEREGAEPGQDDRQLVMH
jgi:hypothetical protein